MNSVNLIGNISSDIDLRATPTGKFVAKFNLAVNNPFNREKTSFLPIEVWGNVAKNTSDYCSKGSKVGVSGYLEVEMWEKDGRKNYKTKIVADRIEFLDSKKQDKPQQKQTDSDPFGGMEIDDPSGLPF